MQHVISLVGIKGGPGKSTVASALAAEWHARKRKVLLVDLDKVQRSSLEWSDYAAAQSRDAPDVVAMGSNFLSQVPSVGAAYDVVILDCPGRIDDVSTGALGLADLALMLCGPSGIEIASMSHTILQVREMRAKRPELDAAILLNKKREGTVSGREARTAFDGSGFPVLKSELSLREDYNLAWLAGMGPTTYRPGDRAAAEVAALTDELERRLKMRGGKRRGGVLHAV